MDDPATWGDDSRTLPATEIESEDGLPLDEDLDLFPNPDLDMDDADNPENWG